MSVSENIESIGGGGLGVGGFGGGGILTGLLVGALLGNRRGLLDGGCESSPAAVGCTNQMLLMDKLGTIQGAIPLAESQTQNAILEQTNQITSVLNQNNIAQLQATNAVQNTVQNASALLLQSGNTNTQQILQAICGIGSKIDAGTIAQLQAELAEARSEQHAKGVEVSVNQNVMQAQAQAQQQQQFANLLATFSALHADVQNIKQGQTIFNSGLMAGSGTQGAAQVR